MENFQQKYYEQSVFWDCDYSKIPGESERIEEIMAAIPADVEDILDAGCGNGFLLNAISNKSHYRRLAGVDMSETALKFVKTEKIKGSISSLPFGDKSFDLVVCAEVMEHLPFSVFNDALRQLQRVSRKYILVTVPNSEDSENGTVMCHHCFCCFNPSFHIRNFTPEKMKTLFGEFTLQQIKEIGPKSRIYAIPAFLRRSGENRPPNNSVCPQCGYIFGSDGDITEAVAEKTSYSKKIIMAARSVVKKITPYKERSRWIMALYAAKND